MLNVTGSITLGNAALAGTVANDVGLGDQFTIVTAGSISGHFAGATTAPVAGGTSATVAFIDNEKFVVDYFADHVVLTRQLASVTMALTKTIASPVYGQPEKFVATLTPESPNLQVSGFVIFTVIDPGGNNFQFQIPIDPATGKATFDPSASLMAGLGFGEPLQLGTYTVTADYSGLDSDGVATFNPASAGPISATVTQAGTTTALASSQAPSMYGVTVTFTATVTTAISSPVAGTLAPTGTVTFRDTTTNTVLGTMSLTPDAGGGVFSKATLGVSSLTVGSHVITATYNGDGVPDDNYLGSVSPNFTQIVNKSSTTTLVGSTPNPSNYGQPVTLTATVAGAGTGTPTGSVTFKLGSTVLGTGVLNASGVASYVTTAFQLPGGAQTITAVYGGDSNFVGSTGTTIQNVNAIASSTSITSSANPSGFGAPVTFTATVTSSMPGGAVPTGTVTFLLNGTTTLGLGTLNASGIATMTTSSAQLPIGTNTITAQYGGDAAYAASADSLTQTVNASSTSTALSAAPASGVAQRAITFTAHVTSPGGGVPTGQVVFTDQKTGLVLGTVTLDASGNAVLVHHLGTPLGNHVVRADYQGDTNYAVSTGTASVNIVANGTRTSTVALKSSANPSNVGVPVTFTATVRDTGAAPLTNPGGTVMFVDKATIDPATGKAVVLGYGTLVVVSPGVMRTTLTLDSLAVGSYDILARYSGNGLFAKSISAVLTEVVKPAPTRTSTTGLVQSSSSSGFGATVSFTATVTDTGSSPSITPSGTVTFTDTTTNTVLGTVSVSGAAGSGVGTAVLSTNVLDVGSHDIVATYAGDTDFAAGADSAPVTHVVTQSGSTLVVGSNANPSKFGQSVTLKATVSSSTGGGVATGTVDFFDGGVLIGTGTLNASGVAALITNVLSVGTHAITAVYAGDGNFTGSDTGMSPLSQVVNPSGTKGQLSRSTADAQQPLTLTATIVALSPGAGLPTGSVTFVVDGVARGTVGMTNGVATLFLPNGLAQGTHTVVVKYLGDGNYKPSNTSFTYTFGGRST